MYDRIGSNPLYPTFTPPSFEEKLSNLNRKNSKSLIEKFPSAEFEKQFKQVFHEDDRLKKITLNAYNLFRIDDYCSSLSFRIQSVENYKIMNQCLNELIQISNNPSNENEEIVKALKLQKIIIKRMIDLLEQKKVK